MAGSNGVRPGEQMENLLRFIKEAIASGDPFPSIAEIASHMGYGNPKQARALLLRLSDRNLVEYNDELRMWSLSSKAGRTDKIACGRSAKLGRGFW